MYLHSHIKIAVQYFHIMIIIVYISFENACYFLNSHVVDPQYLPVPVLTLFHIIEAFNNSIVLH